MTENNGWVKVSGGDQTESKSWDFKTTPEITGIYTSKKDVVTKLGIEKRIYTLDTVDGPVSVWESATLKQDMEKISFGHEVHITFLGKFPSKKFPGQFYNSFNIEKRTIADKEAEEKGDTELPFLAE